VITALQAGDADTEDVGTNTPTDGFKSVEREEATVAVMTVMMNEGR
jgi:hypothetical protein